MRLTDFHATRPPHELSQAHFLAWLGAKYAEADGRPEDEGRYARTLGRVGCPPDKIARRGVAIDDIGAPDRAADGIYELAADVHGRGTAARTARFEEIVDAYFAAEYAGEPEAPGDLIHVTCTGYASPSAAQKVVAARGWGAQTRVTHAYQMGCYAAMPALRLAAGCLATEPALAARTPRVDILHTELCSLHFDPTQHGLEQQVVHSLFADGLIRYRAVRDRDGDASGRPSLRVLAVHEEIVADSTQAMSWRTGDHGMQMTLARDVPDRIAGGLRAFTTALLARAGRGVADLRGAVAAVHPGGPKIIDRVQAVLELADGQLAASRGVLHDYGNMSSATLPHIWMRVLADPTVAAGTLIPSYAFGPGLTMCGALLEKLA